MGRPSKGLFAVGGLLSALLIVLTSAARISALPAGGGGPNSAWSDDFNTSSLDTQRWVVANGQAPGYIPNIHIGYYDPTHVSLSGGYLIMLLTQETGTVGTNPGGVISKGALIYTRKTYGYGTYQWRMRMSSTGTSPTGSGLPESGSVSAGFNYVNNSQTEIDFEFPGDLTDTLYMVNWLNPSPSSDPTSADETYSTVYGLNVSGVFHTYKFVWQPGKIDYYIDGVFQTEHTTNVPTAPAHFMINHWGTDSANWGGTATLGVSRYFYVDWVSYAPL